MSVNHLLFSQKFYYRSLEGDYLDGSDEDVMLKHMKNNPNSIESPLQNNVFDHVE